MPTNLALDDKLILEAVKAGKHRTKKEAVTAALTEYIKSRKRMGILDWVCDSDSGGARPGRRRPDLNPRP